MEHAKPPEYIGAGWFVYREAVLPCSRAEPRASRRQLLPAMSLEPVCLHTCYCSRPPASTAVLPAAFRGDPLEKAPPFLVWPPCIPSSACQMHFPRCELPASCPLALELPGAGAEGLSRDWGPPHTRKTATSAQLKNKWVGLPAGSKKTSNPPVGTEGWE